MAVQKSNKVTETKLALMPKSHACLQTMTKESAKFQIDQSKTVWGHKVPTICHQMPKSKKEKSSARWTPTEKQKNMFRFIFHADAI